jgi:hypothetical protein
MASTKALESQPLSPIPCSKAPYESLTLSDVTGLSSREDEPQRIAKSIYCYVDLGGESATAAAESLGLLPSAPSQSSSSTGVSPNNGAVEHEVLHIWIIDKVLVHSLEDALATPAGESFVDTVPVAVLLGKQPPLGSTPAHPKKSFDESAALSPLQRTRLDRNEETGGSSAMYRFQALLTSFY